MHRRRQGFGDLKPLSSHPKEVQEVEVGKVGKLKKQTWIATPLLPIEGLCHAQSECHSIKHGETPCETQQLPTQPNIHHIIPT